VSYYLRCVECAGCRGLLVIAEVPLEPEEGSFVKVIAKNRKRDGDRHDNDGSAEYGKHFGVKMIVDIKPNRPGESFEHRVVEDVDAVAVFAEETENPVGEETLRLRAGTKCHGDESGESDRYEGEAEGGEEEGMLPEEAAAKVTDEHEC